MDAGMAGNYVQLIIFMGICVGWIGSYLFRVANKVDACFSSLDTVPSQPSLSTANDLRAAAQGL